MYFVIGAKIRESLIDKKLSFRHHGIIFLFQNWIEVLTLPQFLKYLTENMSLIRYRKFNSSEAKFYPYKSTD